MYRYSLQHSKIVLLVLVTTSSTLTSSLPHCRAQESLLHVWLFVNSVQLFGHQASRLSHFEFRGLPFSVTQSLSGALLNSFEEAVPCRPLHLLKLAFSSSIPRP
eukprot:TRINITY_DN71309_c0_g1_i1.p1 TRINITY_DN71309_c0_g1~~TRINITY_DN71309_c0_g1_i1.p1  ORF type:complete len:104 (+),score=7.39 TRINITY_DN71309_c0_g1_i1:378-689(+)